MKESSSIVQPASERVSRTATFRVDAEIERTFPLFGPISEMDWAPGWAPEIVYSVNPVVEEHMVFRTPGYHPSESHCLWALTLFRPEEHLVEYTVSTQNRIWFIRVQCAANGSSTNVEVTYTYTSLNELGCQLNRAAIAEMYRRDLRDWQEAIDYYLKTGKRWGCSPEFAGH